MRKKLTSIFTEDLDRCILTGCVGYVERHHVFGGARKGLSEKYGFIAPLRADLHPNGAHCTWNEDIREIDLYLKTKCQQYYEDQIGTREEFIREFGKGYL